MNSVLQTVPAAASTSLIRKRSMLAQLAQHEGKHTSCTAYRLDSKTLDTGRPRDTRPLGVWTLEIHNFKLGPKYLRFADFDQKPCRYAYFTMIFANFD